MAIQSVKTIRALKRGIEVMKALENHGATSLDQLYQSLKIPKATLSRILLTLQSEELAFQRIADGKWVAIPVTSKIKDTLSKINNGSKDLDHNYLVQAATPALTNLCKKAIWPSDLSVRSGPRMVLIETSRPHTTLIFNKLAVGYEIDFLVSAPGRAYLAFCSKSERTKILNIVYKKSNYQSLFAQGEIETILEKVIEQGYGGRDTRWGGSSYKYKAEYDDGLDAIAVPIIHQKNVLGCINLVWIRSILSRESIVSRHLDDLNQAALTISKSLENTALSD